MNTQRATVIWWGAHAPHDIARELHHRGLALTPSEDEASITRPDVRAVLLPYDARKGSRALRARALRLQAPIVDRGSALFIVVFGEAHRSGAVLQTAGLDAVRVVDATSASDVAEMCSRSNGGPAPGAVTISLAQKTKLSERDRILLQRAFGDFKEITVQKLTGGLTDAKVWRVEAIDHQGRTTQPFLVKADEASAITTEIETMRDFVLDHVPFTNRPPLLADRCVSGLGRRLLVSMFVERAQRLDEYLAGRGPVDLVLQSIFVGPLRGWRSCQAPASLRLGSAYENRVRGAPESTGTKRRHDAALASARARAQTVDPNVADPVQLLARLSAGAAITVKTCQAHGDLHPRNIFVRENSTETILIDFAKAGNLGEPMLLDLATLDVALAFDGWSDPSTEVPAAEIDVLYAAPIFDVDVKRLGRRASAVVTVRRIAKADCGDEREYVIALVAGLLRAARLLATLVVETEPKRQKCTDLIALALRCADRLAAALP